MPAHDGTRVATVGTTEIYLCKNVEISRDIASSVAQLPTGSRFVTLRNVPQSDTYTFVGEYDDFQAAQSDWMAEVEAQGGSAGPMRAGK